MLPCLMSAKAVPVACRPSQPKRDTTRSVLRFSRLETTPAYLRASSAYLCRSSPSLDGSTPSVLLFFRGAILRLELLVLGCQHGLTGRILEDDHCAESRSSVDDGHGDQRRRPDPSAGKLVADLLAAVGEVLGERLAHAREHLTGDGGDGKRPEDLTQRLVLGEPEEAFGGEAPQGDAYLRVDDDHRGGEAADDG